MRFIHHKTLQAIGDQYHISRERVRQILARLIEDKELPDDLQAKADEFLEEIGPRNEEFRLERLKKMREMHATGKYTLAVIATRYNISRQRVHQLLNN